MKSAQTGFTLVEMLVVISIIGILATLGAVAYTSTQKAARDTTRRSDLKQYQNSLEGFANRNGGLYVGYGTVDALDTCNSLGITACPNDPRNADDPSFAYKYQSDVAGAGFPEALDYVLWAKLENSENYLVVCSDGKTGTKPQSGWSDPSGGVCPI